MSHDEFSGKPPKSPTHIRRIVESIHSAIEPPQPGPYIHGLPPHERNLLATPAKRQVLALGPPSIPVNSKPPTHAYYREQLLRCSEFTGGFVGFLLGLNVGLTLPIALGNHWLFVITPFVASLCGCAAGLLIARAIIVERRRDLFIGMAPNRC